jgi:1-acyl-sn-glycerol-3-phosphate acyltransferase
MLIAFCRLIVRVFFREIVIEGRDTLPAAGPVVFTPNHPNAMLDPLLLMFFPQRVRLRFVAKEPLFRIPVLGWMMRQLGCIPVVRRLDVQGEVDHTAFFAACVEALARGDSIVIFPEGRSLPQPYLAPLRTGAARLFFMARERGADVKIVPVGLNYERGAIFRSSVLISIAMPIETTPYPEAHAADPVSAVRDLTEEVGRMLSHHVFQAESYRDRELMLLLERLYSGDARDDSWAERVGRLKQFEKGLAQLRPTSVQEIDRLRHWLARYERLAEAYHVRGPDQHENQGSWLLSIMMRTVGLMIAGLGAVINWLPYRLCGELVRLTKRDEAGAATFKVVFSLFLFPLTYLIEGGLLARWIGWPGAVLFGLMVLPLTYFTLLFFEWGEESGAARVRRAAWFGGDTSRRAAEQLARLRQRIVAQVDQLAQRVEMN